MWFLTYIGSSKSIQSSFLLLAGLGASLHILTTQVSLGAHILSSVEYLLEDDEGKQQEDQDSNMDGGSARSSRSSEVTEAVQLFHVALEANPSNVDAKRNVVQVYSGEGRHDEAAAFLLRHVDLGDPGEEEQHRMLAYLLQKSGTKLLKQERTDEAEQHLLSAIRLKPSLVDEAASNLGVINTMRGDYRSALAYFAMAHEMRPSPTTEANMQLCKDIIMDQKAGHAGGGV
jgi:tetratricopeptide (TPR) repeat protein